MSQLLARCSIDSQAILAGNSRLAGTADGDIAVEPQLEAFKAALRLARQIRDRTGLLPLLAVAFDHPGVFRKQFLGAGLTNSQKRNPLLSQLHPHVVRVFAGAAGEVGVDLEEVKIRVIHEDSARTHLDHLLRESRFESDLAEELFFSPQDGAGGPLTACAVAKVNGPKPTCAAITTEYYRKAVEEQPQAAPALTLLEVFIESDPWSSVLTYLRAVELAHQRGIRVAIRLNLVGKDGEVSSGAICQPE